MNANLRFGIFLAAGAFFLLGPIETQVFLGPARSVRRPYLPMHWHMYHGVGVSFCQAKLFAQRDGARVEYTKDELNRAVGKGTPRSKKRAERFKVGNKVRTDDVMLATESDLAEVSRALCKAEPDAEAADVRAEMRCSPPPPSGAWRQVEDGSANLCTRTQWRPTSPGVVPPAFDPETGEETEGSEPQEQ